jgi:hypothetical protein
VRNDPAKAVQRRLAAAERVRASRRATAERSFVALTIGDEGYHGAKMLMTIMARVGFGLNGNGATSLPFSAVRRRLCPSKIDLSAAR